MSYKVISKSVRGDHIESRHYEDWDEAVSALGKLGAFLDVEDTVQLINFEGEAVVTLRCETSRVRTMKGSR